MNDPVAAQEYVDIVSHELRATLNGIKSWSHVLEHQLEHTDDPLMRRAIDGIMLGVEQQVRTIESLGKEFARLFPMTHEEAGIAGRGEEHPPRPSRAGKPPPTR